jgi:hypothetical protein
MSFTLITYYGTEYKESELDNIADAYPYLDSGNGNITWLVVAISARALLTTIEEEKRRKGK